MAAALDVISLEELKQQFRIPEVDDSMNKALKQHVGASLGTVGEYAGLDILDRTREYRIAVPESVEGYARFTLLLHGGRPRITSAAWIGPGGALTSVDPVSELAVPKAVDRYRRGWWTFTRSADGGLWPGWARDSALTVQAATGLAVEDVPPELKQAALEIARAYFDGEGLPEAEGRARELATGYRRKI